MSERVYELLVCSTCEGKLEGRRCENGHNAYPAKTIKVVKAPPRASSEPGAA